MTLKTIISTILIFIGFLAFEVGLVKMCTAVTVATVCGGAIITLIGFALIIICGLTTFS